MPGSSPSTCSNKVYGRVQKSRRDVTERASGTLNVLSSMPRVGVTTTSDENLRTCRTSVAGAPLLESTRTVSGSKNSDAAVTLQRPSGKPISANSPDADVLIRRRWLPQPRSMVAPAIGAPCGSRTVPRRVPAFSCPRAGAATATAKRNTATFLLSIVGPAGGNWNATRRKLRPDLGGHGMVLSGLLVLLR